MLPIKDNDYYALSLQYCKDVTKLEDSNDDEYMEYIRKAQKNVKQICPTCREIIEKILEYRMENLSKLSNALLGIWKLPPKENPNDKKKTKNTRPRTKK
jgi:hypothetical protein